MAKIIAITQPLIEVPNVDNTFQPSGETPKLTAEEFITYTARVSNPSNQMNMETSDKLLKYLITHKHWSPFEMVSATAEIKTSRGIAAQILRHRSFSFQEFSQRYAKATDFVTYPARRQDSKNRQNSIDDLDEDTKSWFKVSQEQIQECSQALYNIALDKGIAKEQARFLLPLSTETTLYMTGSIRSWIHYLDLRCANGTQKEHMDIANDIKNQFKLHFPNISNALGW